MTECWLLGFISIEHAFLISEAGYQYLHFITGVILHSHGEVQRRVFLCYCTKTCLTLLLYCIYSIHMNHRKRIYDTHTYYHRNSIIHAFVRLLTP